MSTTILFGEKSRELKYDIGAMIALEGAMDGKPSGEIIADLGRWSFTSFVIALWAGLKHEDNSLSPKSVQRMLERYVTQDGANVRALRKQVTDAIEDSQWYRQVDPDASDSDADETNDPNG